MNDQQPIEEKNTNRGLGVTVFYRPPYRPNGEDQTQVFPNGDSIEADADGNVSVYDRSGNTIGFIAQGTFYQIIVDDISGKFEQRLQDTGQQVQDSVIQGPNIQVGGVPGSFAVSGGMDIEEERLSQKDKP